MRVLMVLSRFDQTGMTTHTFHLASALVKLNVDVILLVGRTITNSHISLENLLYQKFIDAGILVVPFFQPNRRSLVSKIMSTIEIMYYMLKYNADIIHVQSPYLSFIPWCLHKKFVSTFHVNDFIRCFYYKNATHLIAISRETEEYAKKIFNYKDKDITIIKHGVPFVFSTILSDVQKEKEKKLRQIPTDKIIIGLVGSIEKRKGHDILLNAIALFQKNFLKQIHVVFVGDTNNENTQIWLNQLIEQTECTGIVTRLDYQDPVILYKLFDIFVLPSRLEGFGLVVVEAMLSGCCCVRSNVEGAYDQIEDGQTGFLFENENVQQLSAILQDLIRFPEKRLRVANAGREKALKEFTSEVMAEKTLNVYKKVINEYQHPYHLCR